MVRDVQCHRGCRSGGNGSVVNRRGFSLTELIVALAIVGVIAFLGALGARAVLERSQERVALANAQTVANAQRDYLVRNGTYAASAEDLGPVRNVVVVNDMSRNRDEVSIAAGADGSLGLAVAENASSCVLVTLASPGAGGGLSEFSAGPNTMCTGMSALPVGEALASP
jgi:prepilin-type N-terminal cleavage/methylation domain-containing protein